MRLYKYLTELFQEKKDFRVTKKGNDEFLASFEVGKEKYNFSAAFFEDIEKWEVFFEVVGNSDPMTVSGKLGKKAIEVYSYVITLMKYFLREYEPQEVLMKGAEPEQDEMYEKLVKRFKKELSRMGYSAEEEAHGISLERKE